jgi:hypothetical protein
MMRRQEKSISEDADENVCLSADDITDEGAKIFGWRV